MPPGSRITYRRERLPPGARKNGCAVAPRGDELSPAVPRGARPHVSCRKRDYSPCEVPTGGDEASGYGISASVTAAASRARCRAARRTTASGQSRPRVRHSFAHFRTCLAHASHSVVSGKWIGVTSSRGSLVMLGAFQVAGRRTAVPGRVGPQRAPSVRRPLVRGGVPAIRPRRPSAPTPPRGAVAGPARTCGLALCPTIGANERHGGWAGASHTGRGAWAPG